MQNPRYFTRDFALIVFVFVLTMRCVLRERKELVAHDSATQADLLPPFVLWQSL